MSAQRLSHGVASAIKRRWQSKLAKSGNDPRRPKEEFVVQRNGQVRQAGATTPEDATVATFKLQAERDLFTFNFGVLDQWWLYPPLHQAVCNWLMRVPPHRKALIVPRGRGKSTLVCQGLPQHMIIQPADHNVYFNGLPGTETRILLAGEKIDRTQDHLRVIETEQMNNALLRALWPHSVWENPKRESKKWNESEMIVPRKREWPDPTIRASGVGGATTGMHPCCGIIDDPATEAAMNSPVVMQTALRWRENLRALYAGSGFSPLEFTTTTKWAVNDVVEACEKDDTVEVNTEWRQLTEGGAMIYPKNSRGDFTEFGKPDALNQLMAQHGSMFWLLYMNTVNDSNLVDFNAGDLREFELRNGMIWLHEDDRDVRTATAMKGRIGYDDEPPGGVMGMKLEDYLDWQDTHRNAQGLDRKRLDYIKSARRGVHGDWKRDKSEEKRS